MDDDRFDGRLGEWARRYNEPPPVPREEIWARVRRALEDEARESESGKGQTDAVSLRSRRFLGEADSGSGAGALRWAGWAAAAGVVLAVGVAVGRWSSSGPLPGSDPLPALADAPESVTPLRVAAYRHLTDTEAFLTVLRADARVGATDAEVVTWAKGLLLETRLLMDSPAGADPEMGRLLEDLELVLVQVAQLAVRGEGSGARSREELGLIASGLEERDVLPRIQAVLPAGSGLYGS